MIRLLIADDHAIVRQGIVSLLEDEPDLSVVAQADNGADAVERAVADHPDIAMLDITMPDMSGLEATRRITRQLPDVRCIILTMHEDDAFFFEALRAGASGYVLKGEQSDELLSAVRAVHQGGVYLPPQLAGALVQDYTQNLPETPEEDPLTDRERQILVLIAQGKSSSDIAEELVLSLNTVKTHRRHIYEKLDLHDRAHLIEYAVRRGLLRR